MTDSHCEKKLLDSMFDHMRDKYKKIGKEDMFDNLAAYYAVNPMKDDEHMNLRDYFAARAMQALLWNPDKALDDKEDVVLAAYEYADAMMKARDGGEDE